MAMELVQQKINQAIAGIIANENGGGSGDNDSGDENWKGDARTEGTFWSEFITRDEVTVLVVLRG